MNKAKKHRWVTEAIAAKDRVLSVWPSPEEIASKDKLAKFFETIERISDDPRVVNIRKIDHNEKSVVFLFDIDETNETT